MGSILRMFEWFDARQAAEVGATLADQIAPQIAVHSATRGKGTAPTEQAKDLQALLKRTDPKVRPLRLNVYKRAKLANSFKWRLLENGVTPDIAEAVTQSLVSYFSLNRTDAVASQSDRPKPGEIGDLITQGNNYFTQAAYEEAITCYQELLEIDAGHADAQNNLGAAFCKLGRYEEAEHHFRRAIEITPGNPEVFCNLGILLRWKGQFAEAEISLRRALKLNPSHVEARSNLGLTLVVLGRIRDAKPCLEKVLKRAPRHAEALYGMGMVARMEGSFDKAETQFKRALQINPNMPGAQAALTTVRKMRPSDDAWLEAAENMAASGIAPLEEAYLRFAIGKYCDDVGRFAQAFQSYKRANELQRAIAERYDPEARTRLVDDLIHLYGRETIAGATADSCASAKPVFVVGMMRSGTSLAEQIIGTHPAAVGAGELGFWNDAVCGHEAVVQRGLLAEPNKRQVAEAYLRTLANHSTDALRVVDKAPVNSDYLGVIHAVFPNARIIYMRRNPIDTCLSCYFQPFSPALNFAMELSDLAHYYREHQRLVAHWRDVLPPGTILDVPYEGLVNDQEGWTRKILEFLGLEWDARCLQFHETKRVVATASYWQVRQQIYRDSVKRWRNYEKFIGPLLSLEDLN